MASRYGWVVTKDHLSESSGEGLKGRVGTYGPSGISDEIREALKSEKPGKFGKIHHWKTWDDDGGAVYSGLFIGDANSEDGFAPLEQFAEPDAGATRIAYRGPTGKWETL